VTHLSTTFDRKWFSKKSSDSAALTWRCPDRLFSTMSPRNRAEYHRLLLAIVEKTEKKDTEKVTEPKF